MTKEDLSKFIKIYNKIYKTALEIEKKDELDYFSFEFTHNNSRIYYSYYNWNYDYERDYNQFYTGAFPITYLLASTTDELEKAKKEEEEYQRKIQEDYKRQYEEEKRLKEEKELQEKIAKEKALYEELKAKYGE